MRWLEATPERYDAGMRVVTLGRVAALHAAVAEAATPEPGCAVLEIGCGTGAVTARLLARGARVTAFEQNPAMLEQARQRLGSAAGRVDLRERTASEIDGLDAEAYDAVVASLCLSEMSRTERRFVLSAARARLRTGGRLVVGDEVRPRGLARVLHALLRAPQVALAWLLAGSLSQPIPDLAGELRTAGFAIRSETRWLGGSLAVVVAERSP
jgi:ubiquinone/menaquinone biosynthesis C-methylase UbiE